MNEPKFHLCGTGALLMDVASGTFDLGTQKRLWALGAPGGALRQLPGVRNVVLGVNNVLVAFDALRVDLQALEEAIASAWSEAEPVEGTGRSIEVPVTYHTACGSELEAIAGRLKLDIEEFIRLHASVDYHVAAIGSVPGFPYLVGLPPQLAVPRLQTPRARAPRGSVAIGGAQAGILPMDMPTGWNLIGHTDLPLFDAHRAQPCLFAPGDRVRFVPRGHAR
jgi:KipI family sensor histidine kinase inhibitor